MKKHGKRLLALLGVMVMLGLNAPAGLAHSGRTDSRGGHNGPDGYHYHHGYPAHQHPSGYCPYTDVFPTGVKLAAEKTVIGMKDKVEITATVSPSNACSKSVSWSSSDTSIVRVSNGKLTPVGFGTATITAKTFNDKTASIKITVQEVKADSVTITGVEGTAATIYIGDTLTLGTVVTPETVDRPEITWTSSDERVATVRDDGTVTGLHSGVTTVTATTTNGLTAQVEVTVEEVIAQKIEIIAPDQIIIGEELQLGWNLIPGNTTYPEVRWQSSDPSVARVTQDGVLTATGVGQVTIQVIQKDVRAQVTFDIKHIPVTGVEITAAGGFEGTLPVGETTQFTANIQPTNATYPEVTWTSSNTAVATVDETGLVTAVAEGEVTVTATTRDGATDSVSFKTGNTVNVPVIAGGAGGAGVAVLGASYILLKRKKKPDGEGKKGVDKAAATCLALAVAVAGGAGFVGVNGANADKYDRAVFLAEAGRPGEAATLLKELGSYEDSADRLTALLEEYPVVAFQFANKGDLVTFGSYEQDNDLTNGKEPIDWLVVSKDQERMLVISQKVLDVRPYIPDKWMDEEETDKLRLYYWLYNVFSPTAFEGCDMTPVRELRMLTRDEARNMSSAELKAEYTPYAKAQKPERGYKAGLMWWLDGYFKFNREFVGPVVWENGSASNNSTDVDERVGVRPVMAISLVSGEEYSFTMYNGEKDGATVTVDRNGNIIGQTGESAPAAAPAGGGNAPSQAAPAGGDEAVGSEAEEDVDWDALDREEAEAKDREMWEAQHGKAEGSE